MSKRKIQSERIVVMTALEATRSAMPYFNGYSNGCGPHKNKKKYNRKDKSWRKELDY